MFSDRKKIPLHTGGQPLSPCGGATFNKQYVKEPIYEDFVVIDFETTGLSPYRDRIIEVGAVKVLNGQVYSTFSTLVDPGIPIPAFIHRLTGISNEMVRGAPPINCVIPGLLDFIGSLPLVAHNAGFDIGFLQANCELALDLYISDTLGICKKYCPGLENHQLGTICRELCITRDSAHRGLSDALAAARIYLICRERYLIASRLPAARDAEKAGEMAEAVRIYESLLGYGYLGCQPHERLAIIYRRMKDYHNEARVLAAAIDMLGSSPLKTKDQEKKLARFCQQLIKARQHLGINRDSINLT